MKDMPSVSFNRTSTENFMCKHVRTGRQTKIPNGKVTMECFDIRAGAVGN